MTIYSTIKSYQADAIKCHRDAATDKQVGLIAHLVAEKRAAVQSLPFAEVNHNGILHLCLTVQAASRIIEHLQNMDAAGEVLTWELAAEVRDSIDHYNTEGYACRSDVLAARAAAMTGTDYRVKVPARDAEQKLNQIVDQIRAKLDAGDYADVEEFSSLDEAFAVMRVSLKSGDQQLHRDFMITSYRRSA